MLGLLISSSVEFCFIFQRCTQSVTREGLAFMECFTSWDTDFLTFSIFAAWDTKILTFNIFKNWDYTPIACRPPIEENSLWNTLRQKHVESFLVIMNSLTKGLQKANLKVKWLKSEKLRKDLLKAITFRGITGAWGLRRLRNLVPSSKCCALCDICDKNAVNQGFLSKTQTSILNLHSLWK